MASKSNSEFNYRYQMQGETLWEKIKHLKGGLESKIRASKLEEVAAKKYHSKLLELEHLKSFSALPHVILNLEAEILEIESFHAEQDQLWELNRQEIKMIERILSEYYELAEPTRIEGYSDEEMFEANAVNEFTAMIGKDIQAEIITNGRPSPAKLRNAMSNPVTFLALQNMGLIPKETILLQANISPLHIELKPMEINHDSLRLTCGKL